tara:strand:+ start:172 stop:684 length:513 start_codon:yes stop_codon:yes gene_type:complete
MCDLLNYIKETNKEFTNKIINFIKDDKDWLIAIGISESQLTNKKLIPDLIGKKISNPANKTSIDLLLKYVITEYLYDDDEIPLIKHVVGADSYGRTSTLFVFKCSELYFCYSYEENLKTLITEDPEAFCWESASSIKEYYKIEKENLRDDFFKDTDSYNDLQLNFDFDKS